MHTWLRERRVPTLAGRVLAELDELRDLTCLDCPQADNGCEYAWDAYNKNGDCLAEK